MNARAIGSRRWNFIRSEALIGLPIGTHNRCVRLLVVCFSSFGAFASAVRQIPILIVRHTPLAPSVYRKHGMHLNGSSVMLLAHYGNIVWHYCCLRSRLDDIAEINVIQI